MAIKNMKRNCQNVAETNNSESKKRKQEVLVKYVASNIALEKDDVIIYISLIRERTAFREEMFSQ